MQVSVRTLGVAQATRQLREQGRRIDPVLRGAVNTTATKTRTDRFIRPLRRSIKGKRLRPALVIKRANRRRTQARIIPSSSGIPVIEYAKWGFDPIDATRARVWIMGPNGKKIAAGFVNPSSAEQKPLSTRNKRGRLTEAYGPSAAYWFQQLSGAETTRWINNFLQKEFERRVRRELTR